MFGGPGTLGGLETPTRPREFWNPKDLWEREGSRNNEGPGIFEGPENPWRPDKPIFFVFY
jgi:hypothetical protein